MENNYTTAVSELVSNNMVAKLHLFITQFMQDLDQSFGNFQKAGRTPDRIEGNGLIWGLIELIESTSTYGWA